MQNRSLAGPIVRLIDRAQLQEHGGRRASRTSSRGQRPRLACAASVVALGRFRAGATSHFPGERFEARLTAQRIEPSVDLNAAEDSGVERGTVVVALFQAAKGLLFFTQREMDNRERISRNITPVRLTR